MKKRKILKQAFMVTVPVLTGYLFIGIAFGVLFQEKGYNFLWAALMSFCVYAGSGQYLAVNFFVPGVSLIQVIFLTFMVNVRHIFYGISLLDRFNQMGKRKWYMIFSLTDETYSLLCGAKIPEGIDEYHFMFLIAILNQSYWIIGSVIGAIAGSLIPINMNGIEFAMTALFLVIFVEQMSEKSNRVSGILGAIISMVSILIFGKSRFILPAMLMVMAVILGTKKKSVEKEYDYAGKC